VLAEGELKGSWISRNIRKWHEGKDNEHELDTTFSTFERDFMLNTTADVAY